MARYRSDDYAGAVADFTETLRLDPKNARAAEFRADALARLGARPAASPPRPRRHDPGPVEGKPGGPAILPGGPAVPSLWTSPIRLPGPEETPSRMTEPGREIPDDRPLAMGSASSLAMTFTLMTSPLALANVPKKPHHHQSRRPHQKAATPHVGHTQAFAMARPPVAAIRPAARRR